MIHLYPPTHRRKFENNSDRQPELIPSIRIEGGILSPGIFERLDDAAGRRSARARADVVIWRTAQDKAVPLA